jgi:hypothetical protein
MLRDALLRNAPQHEANGELVRLGRLERPLNALSTHSLCRLGYRREARRAAARLEDQAGFEPAVGVSLRIKSPRRSAATVTGPFSSFRPSERSEQEPESINQQDRFRVSRPAGRSPGMTRGLADPGGFEPHADGLKVRSLSIRV